MNDYRKAVLQGEIMMLLHDIGKLHWRFVGSATGQDEYGWDLSSLHTFGFLCDVTPKMPFTLGSAAQFVSRIAIAPDWLFGEIVNSNLEVRTSVRIDPATGSAVPRALFTYEAIPQATLLAFTIEIDTYRCGSDEKVNEVKTLLKKSLALCATLGMGGMNTRGFGRVRFLETDEGGK